jgi:hypothetical protein
VRTLFLRPKPGGIRFEEHEEHSAPIGFLGLTLTVSGLISFVLIYSVPVAPLFLIPGLIICRAEANRYQRDTGQTAGILVVAQVACWFFGCLAVLVDLLTVVMLPLSAHP